MQFLKVANNVCWERVSGFGKKRKVYDFVQKYLPLRTGNSIFLFLSSEQTWFVCELCVLEKHPSDIKTGRTNSELANMRVQRVEVKTHRTQKGYRCCLELIDRKEYTFSFCNIDDK